MPVNRIDKVIRIDNEVWNELQRRAVPLEDTPNTVLRREFKLDSIKQAVPQSNNIEIQLNRLHTYCYTGGWTLIPVPKDKRHFFPGYKIKFKLDTDIGILIAQVTSASKVTPIGDPYAGNYITARLRQWYERHTELKEGDTIRIECIDPGKHYKLTLPSST